MTTRVAPLRGADQKGSYYMHPPTGSKHYFTPSDIPSRRAAYSAARGSVTPRSLETEQRPTCPQTEDVTPVDDNIWADERPVEERWAEMRQKYSTGKSVYS